MLYSRLLLLSRRVQIMLTNSFSLSPTTVSAGKQAGRIM